MLGLMSNRFPRKFQKVDKFDLNVTRPKAKRLNSRNVGHYDSDSSDADYDVPNSIIKAHLETDDSDDIFASDKEQLSVLENDDHEHQQRKKTSGNENGKIGALSDTGAPPTVHGAKLELILECDVIPLVAFASDDYSDSVSTSDDEFVKSLNQINYGGSARNNDGEYENISKFNQGHKIGKKISSSDFDKVCGQIIDLLQPAENPLEAIARLGPTKKRPRNNMFASDNKKSLEKRFVFELSGYCNALLNDHSISDVYSLSREELVKLLSQRTSSLYATSLGQKRSLDENDEYAIPEYGEKIWEFRWINDTKIHGPFSRHEMCHWKSTYFDNKVDVRKLGEDKFVNISDIDFDKGT